LQMGAAPLAETVMMSKFSMGIEFPLFSAFGNRKMVSFVHTDLIDFFCLATGSVPAERRGKKQRSGERWPTN
jgi:hypothetical protein